MPTATPVETVASRVREIRTRRGLTAQQLGERMTAEGIRWDRFTVANLEKGKRQSVTVTELLALAAVLNVAPVHLMVPPKGPTGRLTDEEEPYHVTPEKTVAREAVRQWVRGFDPLPGADAAEFHAEGPSHEYGVQWVKLSASTVARMAADKLTGDDRGEHR